MDATLPFREVFDQVMDRIIGFDEQPFHLRLVAAAYQCVAQDLGANEFGANEFEVNLDYQVVRSAILLMERPQTMGIPDALTAEDIEYLRKKGINLDALEEVGVCLQPLD